MMISIIILQTRCQFFVLFRCENGDFAFFSGHMPSLKSLRFCKQGIPDFPLGCDLLSGLETRFSAERDASGELGHGT